MRQCVRHAGPARKFGGAIGEHFRSGARPSECGQHRLQRLRQQHIRSFFADGGIRIRGKNAERLDALFRRERGRFAADGKFSLQCRAAQNEFLRTGRANLRHLGLPSERLA